MGPQDPPLTKIRSHNAGVILFSMAIATNKNGARRRRFSFPPSGQQARGLFVFQVGVALQTQLQLVEQGFASGLVQRRMSGDPLIALADH